MTALTKYDSTGKLILIQWENLHLKRGGDFLFQFDIIIFNEFLLQKNAIY